MSDLSNPDSPPAKPKSTALRPGTALLVAILAILVVWLFALQNRVDDLSEKNGAQGADSLYDQPADLEEFIARISESIVDIACGDYGGTGFAYELTGMDEGFETFIVTNHHVIEECIDSPTDLRVFYGGEEARETEAELYGWDEENDLALVQIRQSLPVITRATSEVATGWWSMAIGNPATESGSLINATTFGSIIGVEDNTYTYTEAIINPGNSGGPLVNSMGHLIGVNTFHTVDADAGIWNTAVSAEVLCREIVECN